MARASGWLVLGGIAAAAAAAAALQPLTTLAIENPARGRTVHLALGADRAFAVTSQHSMYDQPVTEEFSVDAQGRLVLRAVSSPSAAVLEYFGIDAPGERHAMRRVMPGIAFRVAAGAAQRLRIGGTERSFLELGDHGDRLVVRAARRLALAQYLSALDGAAP